MNATRTLIEFARASHRLPASARAAALHLLEDTLAVGAAGSSAPGAQGVFAAASAWGAGSDSRVLASRARLPAAGAAFVNAFQIHCLEWDAVHEPAVVHALSTVTGALMAAIDRRGGCDPDTALSALAVGVDIASGLGIAATSPLRFFRPATAGCIGAALAVARIEGIERFEDVLGLAYSQCAGTMQAHVEGSIALPLQIAGAARAAITAVDLVKAGLTGPHDVLEGPFGYFKLFDAGDLATYVAQLESIWRISEVSIKPFPSGRASHGVLATLDALRREKRIDADSIAVMEAFVPPLVHRLVGRQLQPAMAPAYARLCLPLLSALMLTDGRIDPRRFTSEVFADPLIGALARKLVVTSDGNDDPNALAPQRFVITRTDGSRIEQIVPNVLGHPRAAMSVVQTQAKRDLARELAVHNFDPRIFLDPLSYFSCPEPV
ncbi:MAG: MmgE/PrpD family protein [Steroidobacteraceae bacterium]